MIRAQFHTHLKTTLLVLSGLLLPPAVGATAQVPVYSAVHHHEGLSTDYCGTDSSSPEAARHVKAFLNAKRNGTLARLAKAASPPDIGAERSFNVLEPVNDVDRWLPLDFRVVDVTDAYVLWVEIAELDNGNVTPGEVSGLRNAMFSETPSASIDPSNGFLPNINNVFGLPPNVDGDGLVDVLLYDIGRGPSPTLGYVSAADANPDAPANQGNHRDVLYLDSDRGTSNLTTLAAIAAHEYTHLVHLAYGWDTAFLTEGYAEYAMVMNGYFWRTVGFLAKRTEYTRALFEWRDGGGPSAVDYERAGLFITYIANQIGAAGVANMLSEPTLKGANGIDAVMKQFGSSIGELLRDYHTATLLNNRSLGVAFGFQEGPRANIRISLDGLSVDGETPSTVGEGGFQTISQDQRVQSGAVQYYRWNDVADFSLSYETPGWRFLPAEYQDQQRATLHERNNARILLEPDDGGAIIFHDMEIGSGAVRFNGSFRSVTLIASHLNPDALPGDTIEFEAFWTPRSLATDTESLDLPVQSNLNVFPNPAAGPVTVTTDLGTPGSYRLEIYDVAGRRVFVENMAGHAPGSVSWQVHTNSLVPGVYLVRLTGPDIVKTAPFLIVR